MVEDSCVWSMMDLLFKERIDDVYVSVIPVCAMALNSEIPGHLKFVLLVANIGSRNIQTLTVRSLGPAASHVRAPL